jgi:hypothetical protein
MDKGLIRLVERYKDYWKYKIHYNLDTEDYVVKSSILYKVLNTLTYEEFMKIFWINKYCVTQLNDDNMRMIMNMATQKEIMKILKVFRRYIGYLNKPNMRQYRSSLMKAAWMIEEVNVSEIPRKLMIEMVHRSCRELHNGFNIFNYMKTIPLYVENYVIEKGLITNIYRFTIENQKRATTKDFRYLVYYYDYDENDDDDDDDDDDDHLKSSKNPRLKRIEELLEYAIENGEKDLIKKLCTEDICNSRGGREYMAGHFFNPLIFNNRNNFSQQVIMKCVTAYPNSLFYFNTGVNRKTREREYDQKLVDYAIELDGRVIRFVTENPSYEMCERAIKSNPESIVDIGNKEKYQERSRKINQQYQKEWKFLRNLAIELDPELIERRPILRSKETVELAKLYMRRRYMNKMFDLCVSLHELDLPDEILYEIFYSLYPDHTLILFELWNVTRIVKKQELRLHKFMHNQ